MKCQFFIVHALNPSEGEAELNGFLAQVKLVNVEKQFVADGSNRFWSVCVNYVSKQGDHKPRKGKVDYRDVLNETDFALFSKLRDWRKRRAEQEAVPIYAILTNEQLAEIAQTKPTTLAHPKTIDGVGEARSQKYGQALLALIHPNEAGSVESP